MSKEGNRAPLGLAYTLAGQLIAALKPGCENIQVTGSVRRQRAIVHDIEIIALAKEVSVMDLFGRSVGIDRTTIDDMLDQLWENETLGWDVSPAKQGKLHKRLIHRNIGVECDLHIILDRRSWGAWMAVKTGPSKFSVHLMSKAISQGRHFANGFLLHDHHKTKSGCQHGPDCPLILPLYREIEVFDKLEIPYIPPEHRDDWINQKR